MISFELTEEQKALRRMAHDFAKKEIRPVAAEIDRIPDPREAFPWDVVKKAHKLGFFKLLIPKEYGGLGGSEMDYAVVMEEVGWGDAGFATIVGAHYLPICTIKDFGTEDQRKRWLTPVCEDTTGTYVCALASTEHGSVGDTTPRGYLASTERVEIGRVTAMDFLTNTTVPIAERREVATTAREDGDFYVINGTKRFISNGAVARYYSVSTTIDRSKPDVLASRTFIVSRDTPGVSIGHVEDKMGQRMSLQSEVIFDDVRVPKQDMIPAGGRSGASGTAGEMGIMIGVARAAYEAALEYACVRYKGGNRIVFHQAVAAKLADMAIKLETARLLLWKACWHNDNFGRTSALPSQVKVYGSDVAMQITLEAVQIFGGYGYMRDFPMEKYMRDAKLAQIYHGANQPVLLSTLPYLVGVRGGGQA